VNREVAPGRVTQRARRTFVRHSPARPGTQECYRGTAQRSLLKRNINWLACTSRRIADAPQGSIHGLSRGKARRCSRSNPREAT
jgi:hypothetical protein